jgi:predicted metalloprotease with PDZ domain
MSQLVHVIHAPALNEKLRTYSLYKSEQFFGYGIAFHTESIPATLPSHKLVYPFVEIENFSPASDAGMKTGQRVVAVNGGYVNKDYQTLEDVVKAIEDSYYNRNFTDITVLEPEMWNDFMEKPGLIAQYARS